MDLIHFVRPFVETASELALYIRGSTIELSGTMGGNPLIPTQEFAPPDRLIPYEIAGRSRRGLEPIQRTPCRVSGT